MKKLLILFTVSISSVYAQKPDNSLPMFGSVVKSAEYRKLDDDFIAESIRECKTRDSAVNRSVSLGWRYFFNNDQKTAMKRFNQAWLLNPDFPDSYFGFAALMEMQGNYTAAAQLYNAAITKDTKKTRSRICYQRIADCKEELKDIEGALEAYSKIMELTPADPFPYKKTGFLQMSNGNFEAAQGAYEKAISLDPNDGLTYDNRGYLFQRMKKYDEALADYAKAISINSKDVRAYVNRGITKMEMRVFAEAKADFEICVQLEGRDPGLRRLLGLAKLSLQDKSGACDDFLTAKDLGDQQIDELIKQNCN